jgi:iron(III) transport system permease protein
MRWRKIDPFVGISTTLIFGLLLLFVGYPLIETLLLSLRGAEEGSWGFSQYLAIFERPWLRRSLLNSLLLGALTATFSVVIGFLFAFLIARTKAKGKLLLKFAATLPLISPPFMLALSAILLLGKNGVITRAIGFEDFSIYGLKGLVLIQTISSFPLAYLTLLGVLQNIEGSLEDAALNLGAGRWKVFKDITLPLTRTGFYSAWLLVFVTSLADFATPMLLSGGFDVLSVRAYLEFTGSGNLPLGAALANLLLVPCVAAYILQKHFVSKHSVVTVSGKPQRTARELTSAPVRWSLLSLALMIGSFIFMLYGAALAGAFVKNLGIDYTFSLENFSYIWDVGRGAILDTVLLAAIATPIAALIGLITAFLVVRKNFFGKRVLDLFAMLPLALPGTAIGIGYVLAFNDEPFLLTGTALIIVLVFVFRNLPIVVESAKASLLQVDKSLDEAATNLGASNTTVFRQITLPLIKPAIFTGMAYVFVHCMTAVSAIIFITSARWNHMTVLTLAQTENYRYSAAAVMCLILIVLVLSTFGLLKLLIGRNTLEKEILS